MKFFNYFKSDVYFYFFLFLFYILGISLISDYGISWDESAQRMHGFVNGNYILKIFLGEDLYNKIFSDIINTKFAHIEKNPPELTSHKGRAYGVFYQLPLAFFETVLKIDTDKNIYQFRHFVNFSIFIISSIYFYKYLKLIFKNNSVLCFLGVIFLITNPRIFAQSFYNPKDIIFLSLFIISNYYGLLFFNNTNFKNCFIFSIFSAALITTRTFGLVVPFIISIIFLVKIFKTKKIYYLRILIIFLILLLFFSYVFWPYLWEDPLNRFLFIIKFFAEKSNNVEMLYFGKEILSTNLPWHYLVVYLTLSNPIYLIILFVLGIIKFFISLIKKKYEIYDFLYKFLVLIFFIFIPIILVVYLNTSLYNGWRHFYFLIPSIILFSLIFVKNLLKFNKLKYVKFIIIFIISISYFNTINWMFKNHPYQYVYYNNVISPKPNLKYFSKDYWGVSNKQLIDYVVSKELNKNIYYDFFGSNFYLSLKLLDDETQKKFILDRNNNFNNNYYYLFYNYNYPKYDLPFKMKIFDKDVEKVKEIIIDNVLINGVYKIKKNN